MCKSLADLVDQKVREVQRGAKTAAPHAVVALAALQIADELTRSQEELVRERSPAAPICAAASATSRAAFGALIDREVKA